MSGIINAINRLVEAVKALALNVIPVLVFNIVSENQSTTTDSQTLYFGSQAGLAPSTTAGLAKIYIPKNCTIKQVKLIWNAGTAGTGENVSAYLRVNNTTDYLIQTIGSTATTKEFSNTALAVSVVARDYVEIKIVYPVWATNPANVRIGGIIYAEN